MSTPYDAFSVALGTQVTYITQAINSNLPALLGVAALILGTTTLWRLTKRFVGGR